MVFSAEEGKNTSRGGTASSIDSGLDIPDNRPRNPRTRGITECEADPEQHVMRKQMLDRVSR